MMGLGGGFGMIFGPLMFVAFIGLVVYLVNGGTARNNRNSPQSDWRTPVDILDERLARGDIDRREYDSKRRVLEQG